MKNKYRYFIIVFAIITMLTGCAEESAEEKLSRERAEFSSTIDSSIIEEIKLSYIVGDLLPSEVAGVELEWIIETNRYFDQETLECTGSEGSDANVILTVIFKNDEGIKVEKEITVTVLDSFLRNDENGIVDETLYGYLMIILDTDGDNKISRREAIEYTGIINIERDGTGHLEDEIFTTEGLNNLVNITGLSFDGILIEELIIDDLEFLETINVDSNLTNVIKKVKISDSPSIISVSFGISKIENIELDGNFSIRTLDLSFKDLKTFIITGTIGSIKELNLQGNRELHDYSFLGNVSGVEKLYLNDSDLDKNKVDSIPALLSLKVLILAHNDSLDYYDFLTNTKYPKLELIDFTSSPIINLTLDGFPRLDEIILENIRTSDVEGMSSLVLRNLPKFSLITRNIETKFLNLIIENCPELTELSLEFDKQFTMSSVTLINSGIEEILLNKNTVINSININDLYSLTNLDLSGTRLVGVSFTDMDSLKDLKLDQIATVSDYSFLVEAPNLESLSLTANNLDTAKMEYITTMSHLKELNLSYNSNISNYSFLSSFVNLEVLNLSFNNIDTTVFNSLPIMDDLIELVLTDNPEITDITLENLPNLVTLNISSTISEWHISSLTLKELDSFKEFVRTSNTKINIVLLENLNVLESFNLATSGVTSISIINVEMLKKLDISYNSNVSITVQ